MTSSRFAIGSAALWFCVGCADRSPNLKSVALLSDVHVPNCEIATQPALQIGTVDGDSVYQLHRVRGVSRLSDGRIVVLDAASSEIRLFAADGRFIQKTGQQGSGPGEFRRPWAMYVRSDTIVVIDPSAARLSLHAGDGRFISTRPYDKSTDTGDAWLYDNSVIVGGAYGPVNERVRGAIPRLPRPDSTVYFREVRVAGENDLWVRLRSPVDTSSNDWIIFDHSANARGRTTIPKEFTVYDISTDQLLGVWQDSLGVESVRVLTLMCSAGAPAATAAGSAPTRATPTATVHQKLRGVLEAVALYQEHYYSRPNYDYVYASNLDELRKFEAPREVKQTSLEPPPGVVLRILSGGRFGWVALAADTASGSICGTGEGFVLPQTWSGNPLACF